MQDTQRLRDQAFAELQRHHYQKAIRDLDHLLKINSNDYQDLCCRGLCWFNQKAFAKAVDDFTEVLWIYPIHTLAYVIRGTSQFYVSFVQEAIEDYEIALEIDSTSNVAYQQRSCVLAHLNDFEGDNRDMKQAIHLFELQEQAGDILELNLIEITQNIVN